MNQMKPFIVYTAASFRLLHAVRLFHRAVTDAAPSIRILDWTGLDWLPRPTDSTRHNAGSGWTRT